MPEARARRKGVVQVLMSLQTRRGVRGIPPRPNVPPERLPAEASAQAGSGGGQSGFSAKWVLTFSNKHHRESEYLPCIL